MKELTVLVDGGHIRIKEKGKRSCEALKGIVYQSENIQVIDRHHPEIVKICCVISAKDDELTPINTNITNANQKQEMTSKNMADTTTRNRLETIKSTMKNTKDQSKLHVPNCKISYEVCD